MNINTKYDVGESVRVIKTGQEGTVIEIRVRQVGVMLYVVNVIADGRLQSVVYNENELGGV